ncbi:MAG: DUF3667 domain-containing protein [Saonia sp.]
MECKNCDRPLSKDHGYCPNCGAKVIRNRLSFRNLWHDISERYFNLDNTFLKTFWHLFTKPEVVIGGYINGVRKKYMNPISYLGIALTLSGLTIFLLRKFFYKAIDWNMYAKGPNPEMGLKMTETMFDYSSLVFILYIPLLATAAFLALNKRKFFFSEYIVIFVYILAHYSILSFPISIGILSIAPDQYLNIGLPLVLFIFIYSIYALQRMNRFPIINLILRTGLYGILIGVGFLGMVVLTVILLFATGVFDPQDFVPPK